MESQISLKHLNDVPNSPVSSVTNAPLEDRVAELEFKLATLSRLLQQSQRGGMNGSTNAAPLTPQARPGTPPVHMSLERADTTPYLESPCPSRRHSSRNLLKEYNIGCMEPLESPAISQHKSSRSMPEPERAISEQKQDVKVTVTVTGLQTTTPTASPPQESPRKPINQKWIDYLNTFQETHHDVDVQMQEFIRVPAQLEIFLGFGTVVCVDCFLYILTILPIRFVWSCILLMNYARSQVWKPPGTMSTNATRARFHRRHLYQLIQVGIIFSVTYFLLMPISIGKLYHWIRGQAMLKLYVLIAIVEVFDRLMCSLGQDCQDSMYWNTTRNPRSMRMLISVAVVLVYAGVHTLILFVHVATLNVAMNSADHTFLTLLISGNFAEIKSTVFKKYNKPNLFKITASDVCERFKLALFLSLVLVLNNSQGMTLSQSFDYVQMCGIVWAAEMLSDWIKHSFITKFNFIKSTVYGEYALLLAGDVTGIGHEGVNLDHSHAVVKRIGLAQVPLVCVLGRYLTEAARYSSWSRETILLVILVVWCILLALKYALGRRLQTVSYAKLQNAPELSSISATPSAKKKKKE
jgi:hypothetical protein